MYRKNRLTVKIYSPIIHAYYLETINEKTYKLELKLNYVKGDWHRRYIVLPFASEDVGLIGSIPTPIRCFVK